MRALFCMLCLAVLGWPASPPISKHPANGHYFLFRGKPAILITSAEHYGAVLNSRFHYRKYLDALAAGGVNYTRIYTGAYFEPYQPEHKFFPNTSLGIGDGLHCLPWGRSGVAGNPKLGNKFDLDAWNPDFFRRLKDYIGYAGSKGIVVEVAFYNAQKPRTWHLHPLHIENNVNGAGKVGNAGFQSLEEPKLVAYQRAYVRKVTEEVNEFDNVILEIIDEPTIGTSYTPTTGDRASAWISEMIGTVIAAEARLPNRHLIAQQVEGGGKPGAVDFSADPRLSVIVGQYVWQNVNQVGSMKLLDQKYDLDKVIEFNETQGFPYGYRKGDAVAGSRVEAWEFLVGGGGSFNQLNSLYTTGNEDAAGTNNHVILRQLRLLKEFLYSFDFVRMRRDPGLLASPVPPGAFARAISEPGRQYALYLHHSQNPGADESLFLYYETQPGAYQEDLDLRFAPGRYRAEWVEPATGRVLDTVRFAHKGSVTRLRTPKYEVDLALRIKREGR